MLYVDFLAFLRREPMKRTAEQTKKYNKVPFLYFRVQKRTFQPQGVLLITCQEKKYGCDP